MSRNDKNVMTSTNFDKTLKAISLFCLEHKGFNIKFYACAYVYLFLKYIYKHFLMAQLECRRWSTTLVGASAGHYALLVVLTHYYYSSATHY